LTADKTGKVNVKYWQFWTINQQKVIEILSKTNFLLSIMLFSKIAVRSWPNTTILDRLWTIKYIGKLKMYRDHVFFQNAKNFSLFFVVDCQYFNRGWIRFYTFYAQIQTFPQITSQMIFYHDFATKNRCFAAIKP
jgi:hypothetical protein